jgi:hypothetical protein
MTAPRAQMPALPHINVTRLQSQALHNKPNQVKLFICDGR